MNFKRVLVWLRKAILRLTTVLLILAVIALLLLQTSSVQNYLTKIVLTQLNKHSEFRISVEDISVKWFDSIRLNGLDVHDYRGNLMIHSSKCFIDYELSGLLAGDRVTLDLMEFEAAQLSLVNYQDSRGINLMVFLSALKGESNNDTVKAPVKLYLENLTGKNLSFSYDNQIKDSLDVSRFDYGHFTLKLKSVNLSDLKAHNGEFTAEVNVLEGLEDLGSGLAIDQMKTGILITPNKLSLNHFEAYTSSSKIYGDIAFNYESVSAFADFAHSVPVSIHLQNTSLSSTDISYFAELPKKFFTTYINAKIEGTVSRLNIRDLSLSLGQSQIVGEISLNGLPNIKETFIEANLEKSQIHIADLSTFTDASLASVIHLGDINFNGRFIGFLNDFVTTANFNTELGDIQSDVNLKFPAGIDEAKYSGKLKLINFDVGKLLKDERIIGKINLNGKINGKGTIQKNAKFNLDAILTKSAILKHNYDYIRVNGNFSSQYFDGRLVVDDPACKLDAIGNIDLAHKPEVVSIEARIDSIDFKELGWIDHDLTVNGRLSAKLKSLTLDSIEGEIRADSLNLVWMEKAIAIDSVILSSYILNKFRKADLVLPELHFGLEGDFILSQVISDYKMISNELQSYFTPESHDSTVLARSAADDYSIDFLMELGDVFQYGETFLNDRFYLSPGVRIDGTFYQRKNATLSLYTEVDSIFIDGMGFSQNEFDLNLSKSVDSRGIIAAGNLVSARQWWRENLPTEDLLVEAVWFNDEIDISTNISQPANDNSAYLNGKLQLEKDRLVFNFLPSRLIAFDQQWFFNPNNRIVYDQNNFKIERMQLYQGEQSVEFLGNVSMVDSTSFNIAFRNFDLLFLSALLPFELGGELNANIDISKRFEDPIILESDLDITSLEINSLAMGDVYGITAWKPIEKALAIDLDVRREAFNTIEVSGVYRPNNDDNQFDINAKFDKANLKLLEPIFNGLFSNIEGFADGFINIMGTVDKPILLGQSDLTEGAIKFDYLGTSYNFDGGISFTNEAINFERLRLTDISGSSASLVGAIYHEGLKNLKADMKISANSFQFLNTTAQDNSLYYGTANATGDIYITGPVEDIVIIAKARTEKGTKFFIPLSENSEIKQKDYITFVDFSDTTANIDLDQIIAQSISGVTLNFELDVTTDAYVELIFDIKTSDIIRGRGEGNLSLRLDTNGEFELFGDLNISEGGYNFTIPTFGISKEFSVVPGSRISWYGDPYAGILDLTATYRQLAAISDYDVTLEGELSQKYPMLVKLGLKGEMLNPSINFNIELEDSQVSQGSIIGQALFGINNDEQDLKRQVFSLLILRKFSQPSSFEVGGGDLGGSLSEFVTNQLSYFISQVDENLEIDVDLASLDADNNFQLRLAYTFLNGRLRVSGGGGIPQNETNQDLGANAYLGDWSLRYLLTDDGHFRIKAFSQTNQIANELLQRETGVSFQYVKSFDDLKELLVRTGEASVDGKSKDTTKERTTKKGN